MKPQSTILTTRCSYRSASGRRCRCLALEPRSGLCPQHLRKENETSDLTEILVDDWSDFQSAQGINFALASLYRLLAANLISARRAAVLAYINSLLLRTLPAIDSDNEAGIPYPPPQTEKDEPSEPLIQATHADDPSTPKPSSQNATHTNHPSVATNEPPNTTTHGNTRPAIDPSGAAAASGSDASGLTPPHSSETRLTRGSLERRPNPGTILPSWLGPIPQPGGTERVP